CLAGGVAAGWGLAEPHHDDLRRRVTSGRVCVSRLSGSCRSAGSVGAFASTAGGSSLASALGPSAMSVGPRPYTGGPRHSRSAVGRPAPALGVPLRVQAQRVEREQPDDEEERPPWPAGEEAAARGAQGLANEDAPAATLEPLGEVEVLQ